jgi:RNA polymerase sigma factor (sigma-70 family)
MTELDDHQLLAEYARNKSEPAFAALTGRYVNLVYSAALRFTGNPHHAEEIAQAVFIILARKAGKLSPRNVLSGWLYQTARLTAANFMKGEIRRQHREQEAYMQSTVEETEPAWDQIAPLLDEAMGRLGETDRTALVLRYFENRTSAEIGAVLQVNEDAARRRVSRALEKLRKLLFSKRGVTLSTALIAGAVSANSVQAAPAGLAATISATALNGSAVTASTLTLVKGTLKIMKWLQIKFAAGVAAVILAAGGVATMATLADPANSAPDQKAASRLLQAVQNDDYDLFMQDGDAAFKTLTRQSLDSVSQQLAKRLQTGYELVFLGELNQNGYRVTLWKISFKNGGDDVLEKLSTKAGKVGGVWLE